MKIWYLSVAGIEVVSSSVQSSLKVRRIGMPIGTTNCGIRHGLESTKIRIVNHRASGQHLCDRYQGSVAMEVTYTHCAGLDVHKKTVVACCLVPGEQGEIVKEIRTFSTMTGDLLKMGDWLTHKGVTHVAMESTGEYWKPVYNLLEDGFTVLYRFRLGSHCMLKAASSDIIGMCNKAWIRATQAQVAIANKPR